MKVNLPPRERGGFRTDENESSAGPPPHPRPLSPGKPEGEGRKMDLIATDKFAKASATAVAKGVVGEIVDTSPQTDTLDASRD